MSSLVSSSLSSTPPSPPYTYPTPPHTPSPFPGILTTSRLTLTLVNSRNDEDMSFLLKVMNDPANLEQMGDMGINTREKMNALLHACRLYPVHAPDGITTGELGYILRLKAEQKQGGGLGEPIGIVSIATRDLIIPPDIGWCILPEYHRNGYAPEGAAAVMHWFLHDFHIPPGRTRREVGLIAIPNMSNRASVRSAEKVGLVPMGEFAPLTSPDERTVVYGTPGRGINGGKMYTPEETKVSFFGPGEDGERLRRLVMGETAN